MARRRILIAVVPPADVVHLVRGLRRSLGDHRPERILPHVTIIPPVNVAPDDVDRYRQHVRSVVVDAHPFRVSVSGLATFAPSTPTIHMRVEDGGSGALSELRSRLVLDGLVPLDERPFRAHMTLRSRASEEQIAAVLEATSPRFMVPATDPVDADVADPLTQWEVRSVHLMEQHHRPGVGTRWESVAEEPFGPLAVVGRGGVELVMRTSSIVDAGLGRSDHSDDEPDGSDASVPDRYGATPEIESADGETLCVTAEPTGAIGKPVGGAVGVVRDRCANLCWLRVDDEHRGMGVGRQVLAHWIHGANVAGADVVLFEMTDGDAGRLELIDFLSAAGFNRVGRWLVRDPGSEPV